MQCNCKKLKMCESISNGKHPHIKDEYILIVKQVGIYNFIKYVLNFDMFIEQFPWGPIQIGTKRDVV